jgi:hypothetical protein
MYRSGIKDLVYAIHPTGPSLCRRRGMGSFRTALALATGYEHDYHCGDEILKNKSNINIWPAKQATIGYRHDFCSLTYRLAPLLLMNLPFLAYNSSLLRLYYLDMHSASPSAMQHKLDNTDWKRAVSADPTPQSSAQRIQVEK